MRLCVAAGILLAACFSATAASDLAVPPGARVQRDSHNCYPYDGRWNDRIDRALKGGTPLAIEQDLFWYTDKTTGKSRSVVTHGKPVTGAEPGMREYFFERIRPIMEKALREGNHNDWPLITLNLDFKTDEAEHHAAVWKLLGEYEGWLCTAERSSNPKEITLIHAGPLLVLSGEQPSQERDFHDVLPVGAKLRVFGAAAVREPKRSKAYEVPPAELIPDGATNYRRWWNNPWLVVEKDGQQKAGDWTPEDDQRLRDLVTYAHGHGLWIRFYTLNGATAAQDKENGWFDGYNFGSPEARNLRWKAAFQAGVDYIASDQYEDMAAFLASQH